MGAGEGGGGQGKPGGHLQGPGRKLCHLAWRARRGASSQHQEALPPLLLALQGQQTRQPLLHVRVHAGGSARHDAAETGSQVEILFWKKIRLIIKTILGPPHSSPKASPRLWTCTNNCTATTPPEPPLTLQPIPGQGRCGRTWTQRGSQTGSSTPAQTFTIPGGNTR